MKQFFAVLIALIVLFAAPVYIGWKHFAPHPGTAAAKAQKYHCPMHPTYISDRPGDCPICGMRLVPMTEETHEKATGAGDGVITLDARERGILGIQTAPVEMRRLTKTFEVSGRVDRTRKWVDVPLHVHERPYVQRGIQIAIRVPGAEQALEGTVNLIDQIPDALMHTYNVRIRVADAGDVLRPFGVVSAVFKADLGEGLAVPEAAVFPTGTEHIVFVEKSEGVFEPRPVTVSDRADGWYRVETGLAAGEKVVTNGNFLVGSESRLKSAIKEQSHDHAS